jgi:hypothetical protein
MSNPLLRPEDPRFRRPDVRDGEGKNRFADDQAPAEGDAGTPSPPPTDVFAASASGEERPYLPRYNAQQPGRPSLLLLLSGLGWLAAAGGILALLGLLDMGWIAPLLGLGPAAAAWLLAYEDLKAIQVGAVDHQVGPRTRHALWLGLTGLLLCLAIVAAMVYRQMNFLPDVF